MERNTFLAIILSILVLYTYQVMFPAPKQAAVSKNSQIVNSQSVTQNNLIPSPAAPEVPSATTQEVKQGEIYRLKAPNLDVYVNNVGGTLHKIDFIGGAVFPVTKAFDVAGFENVPYEIRTADDKNISLVYSNSNIQVIKTFTFVQDNVLNVRLDIKNISSMSILGSVPISAFWIDCSNIDNPAANREGVLYEYSVYTKNKVHRTGSAYKFSSKNDKGETGNIGWLGFRDHYRAFIVKPEFPTAGYQFKSDSSNVMTASLRPQDKNLSPGESVEYEFKVYAGPQDLNLMKKYGQGFEKIIAFSNIGVVDWIAQVLYRAIPAMHSILKSWGMAIVLVSIMLYGLTYPLTMKSMVSMRKMQEAQPKINALRDRYKNDPQKLNAEMMEIYRREKINPFGGCLPFIIQMPFFMALYQVLWRAQYFQGKSFLWIKDLSQPDRLLILPFYLPLIGNEFNILPIATGIVMFLQQRVSSKNMVVTDEQQAMQQKMMMYILPVMMAFMFYKFSSAWSIYFFIFYILSTLTQIKIAQMKGSQTVK